MSEENPTTPETDESAVTPRETGDSPASPEAAVASVQEAAEAVAAAVVEETEGQSFDLPDFAAGNGTGNPARGLDLLNDVQLDVTVELGRTEMLVEDVLRLNTDSVIELDKAAGDPVDIYVNDRHVARGEVLVLSDSFCVRISEIIQTPGSGAGGTPGHAT